jgi:tetratricopeptide (TPR) repeat protein
MSIHLPYVRKSLLLSSLLALFALGNLNHSIGQDALPPVRELLAQTLALCSADRENNRGALNDLAAAQCYLGEFAAARKTLLPHEPNDIFQLSAHHTCARIEIELTSSAANIPAALWNDEFGFMHYEAALAYFARGEFDKAQHHIDSNPKSHPGVFGIFCPKIIPELSAAKQTIQCRKVLRAWASSFDNTKSIFEYRNSHQAPRLVAWLVEFDERPTAVALCERWHSILKAETDLDECGEFIGRSWAEYAVAAAALGDKPGAKLALRQASDWTDKALTAKLATEELSTNRDFAQAYAALAGRQAAVLGNDEAQAAYRRAYELARHTIDNRFGEYTFERIVIEQLRAGDVQGTRQTIRQMTMPRYIARAWREICDHQLAQSEPDSARAAAREAVGWFLENEFEPAMAHDMARVAATAALAGEKELAQKLFRRALALSDRNEDPKFDHSWIAGQQVHARLLLDGFQTIQSVPDPADRTIPLAELCRAMAHTESKARK